LEWSAEQKAIKEMVVKYATDTIAPIHEQDEIEGRFRPEIVREMGKLGFWGAIIPEKYGGSNAGFLTAILITEAVSKVSPAYAGHIMNQTVGPGLAILDHGTEEQRQKYLPHLVDASLLGCFSATEPDAGSDLAAMRMTAEEDADGFLLNGTKTWVTNAPAADIGLIFCYTDKQKRHHGISGFLVELKNNIGIVISPIEKLGQRCSKVGEIFFEDARIPGDSLLGQKGEGFPILMGLLGKTRLFAAARAIGLNEACLEKCVEYARTRIQFGKPIGKFQMIQEQIAEMYINHEAAKALVYRAAVNMDMGKDDILAVSAAKYFACESAVTAADTAMKIFGAYSFSMEYPVQRYLRDSRAFVITEGSSNIQKIIIARKLLQF
jgi:glutaryl-CoA dehydrogenase (non-decarboxylating)